MNEKLLQLAKDNAMYNNRKFNGILIENAAELNDNYYDLSLAMRIIELVTYKDFEFIFSNIYRTLKPGGFLLCTFHNWRSFSALYLPWLLREGKKIR